MFGFMGGRPPLAPRFSIPFLRPLPPVVLPPPPPPPPPAPVARGGPSDPFLQELVVAVAERTGLPPRFVAALVDVESGWNPLATNERSQDFGLFQINRQHFGKRYFPRDAAAALDPVASAAGAVVLLSEAANRWGRRDLVRVAAEFNGGFRAARALADRPDVQGYVVKVLRAYRARGGR